jgi:hypothetical protein
MLNKPELPWLYFGIVVFQSLHGAEEVLTNLWNWMPHATAVLHEQLSWITIAVGMGETNFVVSNLVIVAGMLALMPFVFRYRPWAMNLALLISFIEIANGVGHLIAAWYVGGYFPGVLAGIGSLVSGIWFILRWRTEKL